MKRLGILLSALIFTAFSAFAAIPDNDDIYAKTADAASPYYYPNLMLKFDEWRTPMGADEMHYLYYGYAFTDEDKPLENDPYYTRTMDILTRIAIDGPSGNDLDELILTASQALVHDPFSPQILNILAYAYGMSGDVAREKAYSEKCNAILQVIESSGDGLREKTPMHIIMFSHAADLIAAKGWDYGSSRVISRNVEFIPFDIPHNRVKGYYFDFSRIYWNKPDNYTFKRHRTWQFNNLKPREYK